MNLLVVDYFKVENACLKFTYYFCNNLHNTSTGIWFSISDTLYIYDKASSLIWFSKIFTLSSNILDQRPFLFIPLYVLNLDTKL